MIRKWLLKLANGIALERYEHEKLLKENFEGGYEALKAENRQLKTKIKELKLQSCVITLQSKKEKK